LSASSKAFTLVETMIVVTIMALLAAFIIPNRIKARMRAERSACISNLRQLDGAIQQWAWENKKDPGATVAFTNISVYLKHTVICPSGGTSMSDSYTITTVAVKPVCRKVSSSHALPRDTSN
jgi:prepilin-type N-terminal cleavage/methylation domain-containing protein